MIQFITQLLLVLVLLLSLKAFRRLPLPFRYLYLSVLLLVFVLQGYIRLLFLVLLLLSALFNLFQDRLIYRKTSTFKGIDRQFYEEIRRYLTRVEIQEEEGVTLRGWERITQQSQALVVFLHGIGGFNIQNKLKFIKKYCQKAAVSFLIVAYRGYVDSTGSPSEQGLKRDASAIMRYAFSKGKQVIVHGKSLGGAVAVHVSADKQFKAKIKALILQNTFTTFKQAACSLFPYFKPFILYQVISQWRSIDLISKVEVPTLFISSRQDSVIPPCMMDRLYSALNSKKMFYRIQTGTHGHTWQKDPEAYFQIIDEFLLIS